LEKIPSFHSDTIYRKNQIILDNGDCCIYFDVAKETTKSNLSCILFEIAYKMAENPLGELPGNEKYR